MSGNIEVVAWTIALTGLAIVIALCGIASKLSSIHIGVVVHLRDISKSLDRISAEAKPEEPHP